MDKGCHFIFEEEAKTVKYNEPIPILIGEELKTHAGYYNKIKWALNEFKTKTLVSFVEILRRPVEGYYVHMYLSETVDSISGIGLSSGETPICISEEHLRAPGGCILHELMHALGFGHEHQRPDRRHYVNVIPEVDENYEVPLKCICIGKYDPESVMHYTWDEILKPKAGGCLTKEQIEKLKPTNGYPETFSPGDIMSINFLTGKFECTFNEHGRNYIYQSFYECITCWGIDSAAGCCLPCRYKCHIGHEVIEHQAGTETFFCDCGQTGCLRACTSNSTQGTPCYQPAYSCSCGITNFCHPCYKLYHSNHQVTPLGRSYFECNRKV